MWERSVSLCIHTHIYTQSACVYSIVYVYTHIYIYILSVYVCVCMCMYIRTHIYTDIH